MTWNHASRDRGVASCDLENRIVLLSFLLGVPSSWRCHGAIMTFVGVRVHKFFWRDIVAMLTYSG